MQGTTAILVHGAGHTSAIWRATQEHLEQSSFAVDLPGRAGKGGDLASLTVAGAAASLAADISDHTHGDVVLVGHSIAGTLLPSVASRLPGRVRRLVFVAGITAREGQLPADVFASARAELFSAHLAELRTTYAGLSLEQLEPRVAHALDSLALSCEPMRWANLPDALPRTFVRCLQDRIQSREVQAALIESCGAHRIIDIQSGHTPAVDAPATLASILADVLDETAASTERARR